MKNPFDHAGRGLTKRAGLGLLAWLLRVPAAAIDFASWLDTRLSVPGQPERVCDTIAHVCRADQGGAPWAAPVEFQAAPDGLMFGRAAVYAGMLWLSEKPTEHPGDRFDVVCVVVNFTGRGDCSRRMAWLAHGPDGGVIAETTLAVVEWNLQDLDAAEVMSGVERGEVPLPVLAWISLMKNGGDPGILLRWRVQAERESDPVRKADLALVVLFADLTGRTAVWKKALEGFNVIESPTADAWTAKGQVKGQVKALVAILEKKFGAVPAEVQAKIDAAEKPNVLHEWVVLAATVDSLDEFRQAAGI